jgi:hypothetical protein
LLAACALIDEGGRRERLARIVQGVSDWRSVLQLAQENRVHATVYWRLREACPRLVPAPVMEELELAFQRQAVHNLALTRELIELLALFRANGIGAVAYKGPPLAALLYGSLGLRHFWDLDVLIDRKDVLRAKELVLARGYRPERTLTADEEAALLARDCEYNFDREHPDVHLEIHWEIIPPHHAELYSAEELWSRVIELDVAGAKVPTLPPDELLLLLCIHGGDKHSWSRLKWICDIALLVQRHRPNDWERILARARSIGKQRTLALGIYLARVLLEAPVPEEVMAWVRADPLVAPLAGLVRGRLFREGAGLPGFREWRSHVRSANGKLNGTSRVRDLVLYLRAVLTPGWSDHRLVSVPSELSFLYYFLRPLRLASKHKTALIRRLR